MTDNNHPITPPPDLILGWCKGWNCTAELTALKGVATQAARWGANQELEACCEWLVNEGHEYEHVALRDARRPKPPSFKEQALAALDDAVMLGDCITISDALPTIRRALEQLDD